MNIWCCPRRGHGNADMDPMDPSEQTEQTEAQLDEAQCPCLSSCEDTHKTYGSFADNQQDGDAVLDTAAFQSANSGRSRTAALCFLCVVSGTAANVAFVQMGRLLPQFPLFLVCSTTAFTALLFAVWWAWCTGWAWLKNHSQPPSQPRASSHVDTNSEWIGGFPGGGTMDSSGKVLWLHYLGVAVLASGASYLAQLANTHVSGAYQALIGQMHLPFTVAMSRVVIGQRYSWPQHLGAGIVLLATCLPVIWDLAVDDSPGTTTSKDRAELGWALALGASQLPVALTSIWEQYLLGPAHKADELHYLASTTSLSVGLLVLLSFAIGTESAESAICAVTQNPRAAVAIATFVMSTVVYYYCLAAICKNHSATFQVMINAMVTPVSAVAFGMLGQELSPLAWLACGIVPMGVVVYQYDRKLSACLFGHVRMVREDTTSQPSNLAVPEEWPPAQEAV